MAKDSTGVMEPSEYEKGSETVLSGPDVMPGYIKAIDRGSVHKICSGQVVLTLATAVKELVENSVDAGATSVEIKLKEYGYEMIEVIDNGSGVQESNFEGLTLKHHTSKLQDFSDLINVETFGFRGEALSSLCALSQLSITTRHKTVSVGHRLEFDNHGKLTSKTPCARQIGTTVTLQNLFSTLPVRHKEFQRHLKKEFSKMIQVLNAYCIISKGVRLSCSNQNGKGKRNMVVSTNGNSSLRENISNIFGPKQLQTLLEFQQIHPADDICEELGLKIPEQFHIMYKVTGFVSSCCHGQGRSSTDRQFYFINQRPCDPTKVSKLLNEVYHTYNRHQYPFVALNIVLEKEHVDVNVTPDKRQIFVQEEKLLLAIIKSSLMKMFEPIHAVYQINSVPMSAGGQITSMFKKMGSSEVDHERDEGSEETDKLELNRRKPSIMSTLANLKRSFSSAFFRDEREDNVICSNPQKQAAKQRRLESFISMSTSSSERSSVGSSPKSYNSIVNYGQITSEESGFSSSQNIDTGESQSSTDSPKIYNIIPHRTISQESSSSENAESSLIDDGGHTILHDEDSTDKITCIKNKSALSLCGGNQRNDCEKLPSPKIICEAVIDKPMSLTNMARTETVSETVRSPLLKCTSISQEQLPREENSTDLTDCYVERLQEEAKPGSCEDLGVTLLKYDNPDEIQKKETKVSFSMEKIREKFTNRSTGERHEEFCRSFRATISPGDNQSAEEELQREIKKEMFAEMEILGQFNLGFIIARLKDDLFIIDQHATDEKYNFEMLQKNTVIQSQRLIRPLPLELTASNEIILMDNIDIFKKNGFDFDIDENGNPTQRVKLTSSPMSKNWTFGKEDIEEMLFMLSESPGVSCRPSRVRQMFASRSCRKAVMIGTALDTAEMRKLVNHMGEIEQPWNCPHGRPTMRHLINLRMVQR